VDGGFAAMRAAAPRVLMDHDLSIPEPGPTRSGITGSSSRQTVASLADGDT